METVAWKPACGMKLYDKRVLDTLEFHEAELLEQLKIIFRYKKQKFVFLICEEGCPS